MNIPSNKNFKSLNLSHSLILVCHILFNIINKKKVVYDKSNKIKIASKKQIKVMMDLCINNLDKVNFFTPKEKILVIFSTKFGYFFKKIAPISYI